MRAKDRWGTLESQTEQLGKRYAGEKLTRQKLTKALRFYNEKDHDSEYNSNQLRRVCSVGRS